MGTVENFLGSRLGLRSSRVTSSSTIGEQDECEQLISNSERAHPKETKKSQGRPWKAKREDYDEDVFSNCVKENGNAIPLQRTTGYTQNQGLSI